MSRPTFDEVFINMVKEVAARSTCHLQQLGAILVRDNRPIAMGYNGRAGGDPHCIDQGFCFRQATGNDRDFKICMHAEQNALMFAAKNGISTDDTTMYVNTDPCITCAKLMTQAGIKRVVVKHLPEARRYQYGIDYLEQHGVELVVLE